MRQTRGSKMSELTTRGRGRRGRIRNQTGIEAQALKPVEEVDEEEETEQPLIRRSSRKKMDGKDSDKDALNTGIEKSNLHVNENIDGEQLRLGTRTKEVSATEMKNKELRRLKGKYVLDTIEDENDDEETETDEEENLEQANQSQEEEDEEEEEEEDDEGLEMIQGRTSRSMGRGIRVEMKQSNKLEKEGTEDEEEEEEDEGFEVKRGRSSIIRGRGNFLNRSSQRSRLVQMKEENKRKEVQKRGVKRRIDDYFNANEVRYEARNVQESEFVIKVRDWHKEKKTVAYAKYDVLEDVQKLCTTRVQKLLEESCLKNIVRMSVRKFPPKLIQHLLERVVKNENPNELSFRLGEEIYNFGICDFCLITGLECRPVKNIDLDALPESELVETIFEGCDQMNWYDLRDGFMECDFKDEELSLKITKLYLMESLVVVKQCHTNIESMHFRLVEDDEAFNTYSWGRLSYNLLIASLKKILKFQNTKFHRLSGFPQAIVIWACEILPALSLNSTYARRLSFEHPRILNWDYHKQGTWISYQKEIFKEPAGVQIEPTSEEIEADYLKPFFEEFEERKKAKIGKRSTDRKRHSNDNHEIDANVKKIADDVQIIISHNYMMRMSMDSLTKRVDELQKMLTKENRMFGCTDDITLDKNPVHNQRDMDDAHITDLRSDRDEVEIRYETSNKEIVQEKQKKTVNADTNRVDKGKKQEINDGKKKKKDSELEQSKIVQTTKRIRKTGTKLREPYTDKFGSGEKQLKGPSFHILTPQTQEE